jgi:hypothetical protein
MVYTSAIFESDGFELSQLRPEDIRYGLELRLPFRVRTGTLIKVPPADKDAEIWLFNSVAIPSGSHLPAILHSLLDKDRASYRELWTQAVVILSSPSLVDGAVEALRNGDPKALGLGENKFRALTALNEVIYGYSEVTISLFGGAPLRFLTDTDLFEALRLELAFLAVPDYVVTDSDIREILDWRPERELRSLGQLTGDLTDLDPDTFAAIPDRIHQLREHAYHELAFKAKTAMVEREPVIALVLACAALEGAHAALLRKALSPSLSTNPKGVDGLTDSLLREQGIYTLMQLTLYAFMDAMHRPTAADIASCLDALIIRNDIVHAKQKRGAYKLRTHTFNDLSTAYAAVLKVYSSLAGALA